MLVPRAHAKPFTKPRVSRRAGGALKGTQVSQTQTVLQILLLVLRSYLTSCFLHCHIRPLQHDRRVQKWKSCISQHPSQKWSLSLALTWASQCQTPHHHLQKQLSCHMLLSSKAIAQINTEYTGRAPVTCTLQDCTPHTGSLAGNPTKRAQARSLPLWCTAWSLWHCLPRPQDSKSLFGKRWRWNPRDYWLQHHQYKPDERQKLQFFPVQNSSDKTSKKQLNLHSPQVTSSCELPRWSAGLKESLSTAG